MPDSQCSENVEGCLTAEDCNTGWPHKFQPYPYYCILYIYSIDNQNHFAGLECNRLAARPYCMDIDECTGDSDCPFQDFLWSIFNTIRQFEFLTCLPVNSKSKLFCVFLCLRFIFYIARNDFRPSSMGWNWSCVLWPQCYLSQYGENWNILK